MPGTEGEAFAKVLGPGESEATFRVRFTSRDAQVAATMNAWAVR